MDAIFEALASAPRRRILLYLADDDLTSGQIAARFDMSKPAISKHLQVLENAGLVGSRKRGQYVHYWLLRDDLGTALQGFLDRISPPAPAPEPDVADDSLAAARQIFANQLRRAKEAHAADVASR